MTTQAPGNAFVLMPFDSEFDALYETLIAPALTDAGYICRRADSLLDQQNVMRDVVQGIGHADLVVAELTQLNANVFYEVGLAHGLGIPTILLTQDIDEVPFDLRSYRLEVYSTRFDEVDQLRTRLHAIASEHRGGRVSFGSPVSDFLSPADRGFGSGTDAAERDASEFETPGVLDQLAELEEAGEILGEVGARIAQATTEIGEDLRRHAERMVTLQSHGGPGAVTQARRIAAMAASDMVRYADRLEAEIPRFESTVDSLTANGIAYLGWAPVDTEAEQAELAEARLAMEGLLEGCQGALEGTREMHSSLEELVGASIDLDRATRRVAKDLNQIIIELEKTEAFCLKSIALIDERLRGVDGMDGSVEPAS